MPRDLGPVFGTKVLMNIKSTSINQKILNSVFPTRILIAGELL